MRKIINFCKITYNIRETSFMATLLRKIPWFSKHFATLPFVPPTVFRIPDGACFGNVATNGFYYMGHRENKVRCDLKSKAWNLN